MSSKTGGKAPRRSVPRASVSASKQPARSGYRTESAIRKVRTPQWDRRSAGKWASGQSYSLSPGSEAGVARRRNTKKYVARTKKVIRPRILKRPRSRPGLDY